MMKRLISRTLPALALVLAAPTLAQDAAEDAAMEADAGSEEDAAMGEDPMAAMADLFGGMFEADELTEAQEARLPAATALVSTMMPDGFYAEMMDEMMDSMMGPMMSMFSGETGAMLVIGSRINAGNQAAEGLSPEEKIELAKILDPAFAQRGMVIEAMMSDLMKEAAIAIEPAYREGLSRAYAVRFDDAQISDIAGFFATPTGSVYATENMKLMADPQVMSASMQAVPAMMSQFGDMAARIEEQMAELPPENSYEALSEAQRARLSELLRIAPADLSDAIKPPKPMDGGSDSEDDYDDFDDDADEGAVEDAVMEATEAAEAVVEDSAG